MGIAPAAPAETNSVLGKVRFILEAFGSDDESLSLAEISRRTGFAKATAHRLARELVQWGLLERRGSEYWLGMRLFELGQRVPRQRILRDVARPFMEDLFHETKHTIHLAVADGREVLYLDKVTSRVQDSRPSRVAGRMPLHCTATGKALMAFGPSAMFAEVVSETLTRRTAKTIVTPDRLAQELRHFRQLGYAFEREQTRVGYLSVAAPLQGATGATVAAVSITAPMDGGDVERFAALLSMVSRRISKSLVLRTI